MERPAFSPSSCSSGRESTVPAWESGQGHAEVEAVAEAGEGWGGMHHSTTALGNLGTAQYCVFTVTVPRWDQYLTHPSYRHCKSCQGSPGFVSPTKGDRRGAAQVTVVGGDFTPVPAHTRVTVDRATKKKLLSSSVSRESFTTRKPE